MARKASSEPGKIISLPTGAVCFGRFRFDPTNVTLSRGDAHIHLPPRAMGVLEYMVRRPGRLVAKEELLEAMWADVHVTEDALTQAISLIRQALGDDPRNPSYVETVPRLGYRFVAAAAAAPREGALAAEVTLPGDTEIPPQPAAHVPRWRRALPWGLVVLFLVATVGLGGWLGSRRDRPSAIAPPQRFDVIFPADVTMPGGSGPSMLAVSPDGAWIAFVGRTEAGLKLFLRRVNELEATVLPGTERAFNPFFSPDSEWLGFGAQGKLKAVPVAGGAVREICDAPQLRGASWGEDGTIIFGFGTGHLGRVASSGGTPEIVASPDPEANLHAFRWPQLLPGGQAALFTAQGADFSNPGDWRVLLVQLGSGKIRELLRGAATARYVPTGHLLYVQRSPDYPAAATLMVAPFDPQRMELTGAAVRIVDGIRIGEGSASPFYSVSDTGLLLYAPEDPTLPKRQLVWVDRSGTIMAAEAESRAFDGLRLSPDGRRVALEIAQDIWVLDFDRHTWNRLTTDGLSENPVWSPDGKKIAYNSGISGTSQIYQVPALGGGPVEQLTEDLAQFVHDYSPDGQSLLYSNALASAQWDIFILPIVGSRIPQPWLQTLDLEFFARISPDGRWVAYGSYETGRAEIYVRPLSGPGPKISISSEGAWLFMSFWSHDGTEISFLGPGPTPDSNAMVAVPVQMGQTPHVGAPSELFQVPKDLLVGWHQIDVAPDGRFCMIRGDPKETEPLRLVVAPDFFEELERLEPKEQ